MRGVVGSGRKGEAYKEKCCLGEGERHGRDSDGEEAEAVMEVIMMVRRRRR